VDFIRAEAALRRAIHRLSIKGVSA
ncbi:MAG: F0F1 ATP synthase subunit epsilon, partial [Desulfamplus sp.]|nr:F0F1 ATP synthase subunit epsilon [Desulfamplus sp.]